jgi:hypothetical protein
MKNSKRYILINHLIKQYDKLHAQSEAERAKTEEFLKSAEGWRNQFTKVKNLQIRARWVLQIANLLVDKQVAENLKEKVEFT